MKVKDLAVLVVLGAVALVGYDKYESHVADEAQSQAVQATRPARQAPPPVEDRSWIKSDATPAAPSSASAGAFKCDGRTHCSQMTSCAEATYFLQHCPGTQMDGNNDGEPCERQWYN